MGPPASKITVLKNMIIMKFCKIRPKQTLASLESGRLKKLVLSQLPNTNQLVKGEQKKVMSYHGVSFERSAKSGLIMNKGWIRPTWPSLTSPPPLASSSTLSRQHPPRTGASSPSQVHHRRRQHVCQHRHHHIHHLYHNHYYSHYHFTKVMISAQQVGFFNIGSGRVVEKILGSGLGLGRVGVLKYTIGYSCFFFFRFFRVYWISSVFWR